MFLPPGSPLLRCQQQTAVTCPPPSDGRTTWSWLCCWGRGTSCSPSSASTSTPATTSTGRSCWSTSGVWKLAQFRSLHISVQHPKPFFYIHSFSFICCLLDWAVLQHHRLWIWVYGSGKDWNTESWKWKGGKVLIKVKGKAFIKVWFQINEAIRQHNIPQLSGAPGTGKRFVPFIYGFNCHAQENLCSHFLAQEKANTWETWPPVWPSAVTRSISTRTSQWRWWPAFSEGCARATCGASWKTLICSPDRSCPSFPVTFR